MSMGSDRTGAGDGITVKHCQREDQNAVEELSNHHLAEQGIIVDSEEEAANQDTDEYESDLDHIDEVYQSGDGGFWIAWLGDTPVGHLGAQDLGGVLELRRMYVREEFRRGGIGTLLVRSLIEHCTSDGSGP